MRASIASWVAPLLVAGARLELANPNPEIAFGAGPSRATLVATCDGDTPHIKDVMRQTFQVAGVEAASDAVATVELINVKHTCSGMPITTPCVDRRVPARLRLFACSFTGTGGSWRSEFALGAYSNVTGAHGMTLGLDVLLDCPFPPYDTLTSISSYDGSGGPVNVSLGVEWYRDQAVGGPLVLPWQGLDGGDTLSIEGLLMPPSQPPLVPPHTPPTPPPSPHPPPNILSPPPPPPPTSQTAPPAPPNCLWVGDYPNSFTEVWCFTDGVDYPSSSRAGYELCGYSSASAAGTYYPAHQAVRDAVVAANKPARFFGCPSTFPSAASIASLTFYLFQTSNNQYNHIQCDSGSSVRMYGGLGVSNGWGQASPDVFVRCTNYE